MKEKIFCGKYLSVSSSSSSSVLMSSVLILFVVYINTTCSEHARTHTQTHKIAGVCACAHLSSLDYFVVYGLFTAVLVHLEMSVCQCVTSSGSVQLSRHDEATCLTAFSSNRAINVGWS